MVHAPTLSYLNDANQALDSLDHLWMELTPKCNLECIHCYVSSSPILPLYGKLSTVDWERCLTEAFQLGCRSVQFIGGEPTLHPDLPRLLRQARSLGFRIVEVFTNGVTFSRRVREALCSNDVSVAFSVYASDPAIHDTVTQQAGSFSKTCNNIKWALAAGLSVRAGVIEMDVNRELTSATLNYLKSLGISHVGVDRMRGVGRGAQDSNQDNGITELCGHCWRGNLCITAEGIAYPCIMARKNDIGDVRTRGIEGLTRSKSLLDFRRKQRNAVQNPPARGGTCGPCPPQMCYPTFCMPK